MTVLNRRRPYAYQRKGKAGKNSSSEWSLEQSNQMVIPNYQDSCLSNNNQAWIPGYPNLRDKLSRLMLANKASRFLIKIHACEITLDACCTRIEQGRELLRPSNIDFVYLSFRRYLDRCSLGCWFHSDASEYRL